MNEKKKRKSCKEEAKNNMKVNEKKGDLKRKEIVEGGGQREGEWKK